jgi:hypothetical protein
MDRPIGYEAVLAVECLCPRVRTGHPQHRRVRRIDDRRQQRRSGCAVFGRMHVNQVRQRRPRRSGVRHESAVLLLPEPHVHARQLRNVLDPRPVERVGADLTAGPSAPTAARSGSSGVAEPPPDQLPAARYRCTTSALMRPRGETSIPCPLAQARTAAGSKPE